MKVQTHRQLQARLYLEIHILVRIYTRHPKHRECQYHNEVSTKKLNTGTTEQSLSGHLFRVDVALDLLEQGEGIEKIMLRRGGRWIRVS